METLFLSWKRFLAAVLIVGILPSTAYLLIASERLGKNTESKTSIWDAVTGNQVHQRVSRRCEPRWEPTHHDQLDGTFHRLNPDGSEIVNFPGHPRPNSIMFSKDGEPVDHDPSRISLCTCGMPNMGAPLGRVQTGANIKIADLSPDGQRIVTVSDCPADCVELWMAGTGVKVDTLPRGLEQ